MVLIAATLLPLAACAVQTVDCWQLDTGALKEARSKGWCQDAFARNVHTYVPIGVDTRPPRRSPPPHVAFVPPLPLRKPPVPD